MITKNKPYRSRNWLTAVRSIGHCVICNSTEILEVAHRNQGKGMGVKTDDCLTALLCKDCHNEIDNAKGLTKDERRAYMDGAILKTITLLAKQGKIKSNPWNSQKGFDDV